MGEGPVLHLSQAESIELLKLMDRAALGKLQNAACIVCREDIEEVVHGYICDTCVGEK